MHLQLCWLTAFCHRDGSPVHPQQCCACLLACVRLQVLEETGIAVQGPVFATAENSVFPNGKHYVTIFVLAAAPEVGTLGKAQQRKNVLVCLCILIPQLPASNPRRAPAS
jgi:hypothetical protein